MTWNAFHRRGEVLRTVVDTADQRRDGNLPLDVPGVQEAFADEIDLVGALCLKWHARLSGNIERAMLSEPMDLESAVASAWRTTADQMPGVRLMIDRATELPATEEMGATMHRARRAERARLAQAAGLANDAGDAAVLAGERIEERARRGLPRAASASAASTPVPVPAPRSDQHDRESFVRRIKAVLAA